MNFIQNKSSKNSELALQKIKKDFNDRNPIFGKIL